MLVARRSGFVFSPIGLRTVRQRSVFPATFQSTAAAGCPVNEGGKTLVAPALQQSPAFQRPPCADGARLSERPLTSPRTCCVTPQGGGGTPFASCAHRGSCCPATPTWASLRSGSVCFPACSFLFLCFFPLAFPFCPLLEVQANSLSLSLPSPPPLLARCRYYVQPFYKLRDTESFWPPEWPVLFLFLFVSIRSDCTESF